MSKTDPEIVKGILGFELALAMLERFDPAQHANNIVLLAMFTVADDAVYDLIESLGRRSMTEKQRTVFLDRVARFEALHTAEIRIALRRYGCSPPPLRVAN
ncbi:hypothetical protein O3U67_02810 [Brevundimonas diminuta]|uniref:hypothetical protein n=1 Tax=Brevundimonas diminuta TaxID=293 RepID=UPI0022AF152C|nr:hypothetical protein [Brevundimonas diminuta]MCZ4107005.1 hypothetical protein [Brevundimonas diminuta]